MAEKKSSPTIPRRFAFAPAGFLTERTKKGPLGEAGQMNRAGSAFTREAAGARELGVVCRNIRRTCLRSRLSVACIADVASIWAIYDADMTARKLPGTMRRAKKSAAAAAPVAAGGRWRIRRAACRRAVYWPYSILASRLKARAEPS